MKHTNKPVELVIKNGKPGKGITTLTGDFLVVCDVRHSDHRPQGTVDELTGGEQDIGEVKLMRCALRNGKLHVLGLYQPIGNPPSVYGIYSSQYYIPSEWDVTDAT